MTVKELIEQLQKYPSDMLVLQASDEECNDVLGMYCVGMVQVHKHNNDGYFEAVLIEPKHDSYELYDPEGENE